MDYDTWGIFTAVVLKVWQTKKIFSVHEAADQIKHSEASAAYFPQKVLTHNYDTEHLVSFYSSLNPEHALSVKDAVVFHCVFSHRGSLLFTGWHHLYSPVLHRGILFLTELQKGMTESVCWLYHWGSLHFYIISCSEKCSAAYEELGSSSFVKLMNLWTQMQMQSRSQIRSFWYLFKILEDG